MPKKLINNPSASVADSDCKIKQSPKRACKTHEEVNDLMELALARFPVLFTEIQSIRDLLKIFENSLKALTEPTTFAPYDSGLTDIYFRVVTAVYEDLPLLLNEFVEHSAESQAFETRCEAFINSVKVIVFEHLEHASALLSKQYMLGAGVIDEIIVTLEATVELSQLLIKENELNLLETHRLDKLLKTYLRESGVFVKTIETRLFQFEYENRPKQENKQPRFNAGGCNIRAATAFGFKRKKARAEAAEKRSARAKILKCKLSGSTTSVKLMLQELSLRKAMAIGERIGGKDSWKKQALANENLRLMKEELICLVNCIEPELHLITGIFLEYLEREHGEYRGLSFDHDNMCDRIVNVVTKDLGVTSAAPEAVGTGEVNADPAELPGLESQDLWLKLANNTEVSAEVFAFLYAACKIAPGKQARLEQGLSEVGIQEVSTIIKKYSPKVLADVMLSYMTSPEFAASTMRINFDERKAVCDKKTEEVFSEAFASVWNLNA